MKGRIITDIGQVSVDTDVIAKYAGMAAVECSNDNPRQRIIMVQQHWQL